MSATRTVNSIVTQLRGRPLTNAEADRIREALWISTVTEPPLEHSDSIEIRCRPGEGILQVSADTVAALDRLGHTLPAGTPWQVDLVIGRTPADTVHLTATPATEPTPEEDAA